MSKLQALLQNKPESFQGSKPLTKRVINLSVQEEVKEVDKMQRTSVIYRPDPLEFHHNSPKLAFLLASAE